MIEHVQTTQERIHGFLVQFEVYKQAKGAKPFRAYGYHGPRQLTFIDAKSAGQALRLCKTACVDQLNPAVARRREL